MSTEKTLNEYFAMFKQMRKEYQFNRKVELNMSIQKFKESNNLIVIPKQGGLVGNSVILQHGQPVGEIVPKYDKGYEVIKSVSLRVY